MKAQKYIKNLLFALLIGAFVAPQIEAMTPKKETFSQRAFKKVLLFGIPAAVGGIVAYNYFPESAYNFLNPKHLYNVGVKIIPNFVGSVQSNDIELPRAVNIMTPVNAVRSALFSGVFHADNVRGATTSLVAGITGCMALRFKRAGIFGFGGSDRTKISNALAKSSDRAKDQEALNDLAELIGCSTRDVKQDVLGIQQSSITLGMKTTVQNQVKIDRTTAGNNETFNQKVYEYIDTQSQKFDWKRYAPACFAKACIPSYFLSKPRARDKTINKILCGSNYGSWSGYCSWLPNYMAYLGASSVSLIASLMLQNKFCKNYTLKSCGYGIGLGALGYFLYNQIEKPTRREAAEAMCDVLLEKYK